MAYLQLLLPDFILIACGFVICRYTALDRPLWEQVEKLVYFFLFPETSNTEVGSLKEFALSVQGLPFPILTVGEYFTVV